MSYPNADTASLANYFLASQQIEHSNTERIAEMRAVIEALLLVPGVPADLVERARLAIADEDDE